MRSKGTEYLGNLSSLLQVKAKEADEGAGLFCDICQIFCPGPQNMKMHLDSKKHQARETNIYDHLISVSTKYLQKKIEGNGEERELGVFRCEICGIGCSDQFGLDAHM